MRGFQDRAEVEEVMRLVDERVRALPAETVPISQASGRVLSADVIAEVAVPGFDRAAMAEAAALAVDTEDRAVLIDSLILCKFLCGVFADLYAESAELLRHVTGWDVTADELRSVARRIVTAKKLYNLREGWTTDEHMLPKRFLSEGLPVGASAEATLPRERPEAMIAAYYAARLG